MLPLSQEQRCEPNHIAWCDGDSLALFELPAVIFPAKIAGYLYGINMLRYRSVRQAEMADDSVAGLIIVEFITICDEKLFFFVFLLSAA